MQISGEERKDEKDCRKALIVNSPSCAAAADVLPETGELVSPFDKNLAQHGLSLKREKTDTLQINVGFLCDLFCRHCHLEAGPDRQEVMTIETMKEVIAYASRAGFAVIDVTGGAPELTPHIAYLLRGLSGYAKKIIARTNLVALREDAARGFTAVCREIGAALVASFPSTNAAQAEALRGKGFWSESLASLRELNQAGYGIPGSGLTLDLVVNPTGAFLPGHQGQTEKKFKHHLERQGIVFNNLYIFANVPLGRFRTWLEESGNLGDYFRTLAARFNPAAVAGLMCRSLISVSWEGCLYDCDFNIAARLPHGGAKVHISSLARSPEPGFAIATGDHCYACTAGAGFT